MLRLDEFDGNITEMVKAIPTDASRVLLIGVSLAAVRWERAILSGEVSGDPLPPYPPTGSTQETLDAYLAAQDAHYEKRFRITEGLLSADDGHISCIQSPVTAFGVLSQFVSRTTACMDFYTDVSFGQGIYGDICNENQWQIGCLWLLTMCSKLIHRPSAEKFQQLEAFATELADLYVSHERYKRVYTAEDLARELRNPMLHRIMIAAIAESEGRSRNDGFTLDQIPDIVQRYYASPTAVRLALNMSRAATLEFASIGGSGFLHLHCFGTFKIV